MRLIFVLTLTISSFCFLSCTRQTANQSTNSAQTASSPAQQAANLSPTETYLAYTEAARKKDLTEVEKYLSKGTIKYIEQTAQADQITVDEVLSGIVDDVNQTDPETRNEVIEGEQASVEYKNPVTGGWDKLPMVKEDERWKIALDKLVEQILKDSDKIEINKQGGEESGN